MSVNLRLEAIAKVLVSTELAFLQSCLQRRNNLNAVYSELFLDEASKPAPRLVSGCEICKPPISLRLVGIETNPGPRPRRGQRDAIKEAAAATGNMLSQLFTKNKKKKRKSKILPSPYPRASVSVRMQQPPVSYAGVIRSVATQKPVNIQPFDVCNLLVCTNAAGQFVWGSTTSAIFNLPLDINGTVASSAVFGSALAGVSAYYRKYRFRSIGAEYLPLVNTSTVGSVSLAAINDGAIISTTVVGDGTVSSCDRSVNAPVWTRFFLDLKHISKDWLWVQDGTSTTSEERQTCPGLILMSSATGGSNSTTYGRLRLFGEVELDDLTPGMTLVPTLIEHDKTSKNLDKPKLEEQKSDLEQSVYIDKQTASKFRTLFSTQI